MEIGRYQTLWRHTTSGRFVAGSSSSFIHTYISIIYVEQYDDDDSIYGQTFYLNI